MGTIERHALARSGEALWVAVSGGVDSMVLLHVLRSLGHSCHVAHVDHGLRGVESAADRAFVRQYCEQERIPFLDHTVEVYSRAQADGLSTQMAARELRYAWFRALVDGGPHTLCLAHHLDDAIESLFLGLLHGLGTRGWRSIPYRSGPFVRPLRDVGRAAILEYAHAHGIPWREDISNRDPRYLRNRIRHELLPMLEEWRPGVERTLERNTVLLSEMQGLTQRTVEEALTRVTTESDGSQRIRFEVILKDGIPRSLLHELLRGKDFHPDVVVQIVEAMERNSVGARFLSGAYQVLVDREELFIAPREMDLPQWTISSPTEIPVGAPLAIASVNASDIDPEAGQDIAWLDLERLTFPLVLRPWRSGDRIRPVGIAGTKLVSDILIDARMPRIVKDRTYVLLDQERVIWVCGHRIARDARAGSNGTNVLRFTWNPKGLH
ncbi:MAG: tRNA lysidine(34) synthetase TilS [Flavobacteriales bacterium]|nr:tRNA lysidine(34) synthetase TilS [Flavobacteriales bacterium]